MAATKLLGFLCWSSFWKGRKGDEMLRRSNDLRLSVAFEMVAEVVGCWGFNGEGVYFLL